MTKKLWFWGLGAKENGAGSFYSKWTQFIPENNAGTPHERKYVAAILRDRRGNVFRKGYRRRRLQKGKTWLAYPSVGYSAFIYWYGEGDPNMESEKL